MSSVKSTKKSSKIAANIDCYLIAACYFATSKDNTDLRELMRFLGVLTVKCARKMDLYACLNDWQRWLAMMAIALFSPGTFCTIINSDVFKSEKQGVQKSGQRKLCVRAKAADKVFAEFQNQQAAFSATYQVNLSNLNLIGKSIELRGVQMIVDPDRVFKTYSFCMKQLGGSVSEEHLLQICYEVLELEPSQQSAFLQYWNGQKERRVADCFDELVHRLNGGQRLPAISAAKRDFMLQQMRQMLFDNSMEEHKQPPSMSMSMYSSTQLRNDAVPMVMDLSHGVQSASYSIATTSASTNSAAAFSLPTGIISAPTAPVCNMGSWIPTHGASTSANSFVPIQISPIRQQVSPTLRSQAHSYRVPSDGMDVFLPDSPSPALKRQAELDFESAPSSKRRAVANGLSINAVEVDDNQTVTTAVVNSISDLQYAGAFTAAPEAFPATPDSFMSSSSEYSDVSDMFAASYDAANPSLDFPPVPASSPAPDSCNQWPDCS